MADRETGAIDRRLLLQASSVAMGAMAMPGIAAAAPKGGQSWEWQPMRWVQICATDDDPQRYDRQFWMDFLKRTSTQGVCLSAGGVTAFYPTKVPFHYRSPYLGKTDMFGDLTKACKTMGIRVLGRVDPHAMHADALLRIPNGWRATPTARPRNIPPRPICISLVPMAALPSTGCPKC